MAIAVGDHASNPNENIAHAAKIIGRSKDRLKVFDAIYRGKKRVKTAAEISKSTGLDPKRTLTEAKRLTDNHLANPTKVDGLKAYEKIDFFHTHKAKILTLAGSPSKFNAYPTKRNPVAGRRAPDKLKIAITIPGQKQTAKLILLDEIDSFSKVRKMAQDLKYTKIAESKFKKGVAKLLGENGDFKDWGGESRDLFSSRLIVDGKRRTTAFAFKGPRMTGRLTPGKMGKNGDQIQRLIKCPADVFIIQYWAQIDDSVLDQLQQLAQLQSYLQDRQIWFGIIDGTDSTRLLHAYPGAFK